MPGDGSPLRFEVLGPLRAVRGDTELDLGPAKQRAVLAVLLLEAGRVVPTPRIVDAVWGDEPPENGANVVQKYVAGLRRVLDPDRSPRTPGALLPFREVTGDPRRLQLAGWVRNLPDGTVEVAASGREDKLQELRVLLRKGPDGAIVSEMGRLCSSRASTSSPTASSSTG